MKIYYLCVSINKHQMIDLCKLHDQWLSCVWRVSWETRDAYAPMTKRARRTHPPQKAPRKGAPRTYWRALKGGEGRRMAGCVRIFWARSDFPRKFSLKMPCGEQTTPPPRPPWPPRIKTSAVLTVSLGPERNQQPTVSSIIACVCVW